ncbi:MAG: hypothetical protein JWM68_5305 [Verrucomicrobiales bacterium]|nr:hypothetical protein [Verrucomicrobiales bacterium]
MFHYDRATDDLAVAITTAGEEESLQREECLMSGRTKTAPNFSLNLVGSDDLA